MVFEFLILSLENVFEEDLGLIGDCFFFKNGFVFVLFFLVLGFNVFGKFDVVLIFGSWGVLFLFEVYVFKILFGIGVCGILVV